MDRVLDNETEAVVIGGMVLDINATPSVVAKRGTTTPGKVRYALGGVARNIAECMSKLGAKPYMISAIGFDWAVCLDGSPPAYSYTEGSRIRHHQIMKMKRAAAPPPSPVEAATATAPLPLPPRVPTLTIRSSTFFLSQSLVKRLPNTIQQTNLQPSAASRSSPQRERRRRRARAPPQYCRCHAREPSHRAGSSAARDT